MRARQQNLITQSCNSSQHAFPPPRKKTNRCEGKALKPGRCSHIEPWDRYIAVRCWGVASWLASFPEEKKANKHCVQAQLRLWHTKQQRSNDAYIELQNRFGGGGAGEAREAFGQRPTLICVTNCPRPSLTEGGSNRLPGQGERSQPGGHARESGTHWGGGGQTGPWPTRLSTRGSGIGGRGRPWPDLV